MTKRPIPQETRELQMLASDPRVSAWVSANAGSGKTHVLTQRVIRLLLNGVPPARILCLTFTKAAAANMSIRVFRELSRWTRLSDAELRDAILATGEIETGPARLTFARRLFARTVETPGGLKIQTIHAFCEKLLHLFPFEANVAARFEVIEEQQQSELLTNARLDTLAHAIHDERGPLGKALRVLAAETSGAGFTDLISEALRKQELIARLGKLDEEDGAEAYTRLLAASLGIEASETVDDINRSILDHGLLGEDVTDFAALIATGGSNDGKLAKKLLDAQATRAAADKLRIYEDAFVTQAGEPRGMGAQKIVSKAVYSKLPDVLDRMEAERDRVCALRERRKAAHVVARTHALLVIVRHILRAYRDEKEARGLLDFSDLIIATRRLLQRTDAGWVLHKLDKGIDHILVDEAQDTSPDQWDILEAIATEFTAGAGQRDVSRTFFAVGDEKQSIFSFQGAQPREFDRMRRKIEARVHHAQQRFEHIELKRSFRSSKGVLDAVDSVFSVEGHFKGLSSDEMKTVHEAWKDDLPGLIELWPIVQRDETAEPRDWKMPLDQLDAGDPPVIVAKNIAREIAALIAPGSGESVEDEQTRGRRPIRPGDVMILVRSRGPFFEAVIRALKEAQVPVAGADRLQLTQHIAVMDLIAAGRAALLPEDDLTLAIVLKTPLIGLDDDDLLAIAPGRKGSLHEALGASSTPRHQRAFARIEAWRKAAAQMTPFFFYAQILGAEHGRRDMLSRLGHEAGDAMDEFLALALEHETRKAPSLVEFLAALQSADLQIKRDMEAGADAVRVMTVHASKGLEAKIVFLGDTCGAPVSSRHDPKLYEVSAGQFGEIIAWSPGMKGEPALLMQAREKAREDSEQEHRRLLYVAMTRAEERLYVASFLGKQKLKDGCWRQMVEATLEGQMTEAPARWDPEAKILRWTSGVAPRLDALGERAPAMADEPLPDWAVTPAPFEAQPQRPLSPSNALAAADRMEPEPRERSPAVATAAKAGVMVHALLQHLPEIAAADRASAATRFVESRGGAFEPAQREAIVAQALAVLGDPLLAPLFGPGSQAEIGLGGRVALPGGREIEIYGQIDRLAVTGNEVLLADFKTGRPRSAADTPDSYLAQLAVYRAAVAPLYPGKKVRCFLVWTEGPLGLEIDTARLEAALLDVQRARS
ncbi:MAG: Double-strand break repair helicase AddA [Hyphomicrobiales bacterium]|nr:Double-strand break repair helicase AddA [Hyphomicrobiales bacterium]